MTWVGESAIYWAGAVKLKNSDQKKGGTDIHTDGWTLEGVKSKSLIIKTRISDQ